MKKILLLLFYCWIIIAVFNVGYNFLKTFSEVREWGYLSDAEKRHKIFGNNHEFFTLIKEHSPNNTKILIFSQDDMARFLSIYYLYPRRVTTTTDKEVFLKNIEKKTYPYIASYNFTFDTRDYEKIASFSSKTTIDYGVVYQLP